MINTINVFYETTNDVHKIFIQIKQFCAIDKKY